MSPTLRAAFWMVGAIVSFTSMAVAGRAVSHQLDTFEIMLFRSLVGIGLVLLVGRAAGTLGQVRTDRLGLHTARNLAHFAGQNLWFHALTLITLAQVFALEFTSPIWVMVLAALFLGERLTGRRLLAVALGFAGALVVARPGAGGDPLGLALAALSAVCFAGSIVSTKRLTRTDTIFCILFWLTLMQAGMGALAAGWDGDLVLPSVRTLPWAVLVGCAGLVAHTCLTNALAVAPATVVTPMDFARLPVIAVVGVLLYAEPLSPAVFLGAALIFAGNYLNVLGSKPSGTT